MSLSSGDKLGPYEILAPIGAGGMGEVYRARDTTLKRDVALKILPEAFARDPGRLARFQREAEVLASLNHPNIAHIYGVAESENVRALIMELVEGESPKGPMPFDEARKIATQIAEALDYAHEKGVVHRDLKPANVKVTPEGVVKLLDFGLAKAFDGTPDSAPSDPANSPTMTLGATVAGTIMGTAAYMAPEQARGKKVDKRADIWAFGVVLYELLTGKRLFKGEDVSDTLAQVLMKQPDLDEAPAQARKLLRRCLEKDPKRRLRDIGEAQFLLEEGLEKTAPVPSQFGRTSWIAAGVFALLAVALAFLHLRETPPPEQALRYTIAAPEGSAVHSFAISPDGSHLVMAAQVGGKRQLWLRAMDALQAQPMPFTDDATFPFWSPDSRYIGFFAQGKLKKIAAGGGPTQSLCNAPNGLGGSWNRDDVIVFAPAYNGTPIQQVSAAGGVPMDVTKLKGHQTLEQRYPVFLPDGHHFMYLYGGGVEKSGIYVSSLDGKENRRVLADVDGAVFAPGHILLVREKTLMAAPFDAASAQVSGDAFPVAEGISLGDFGYLPATVSDNGVLLYESGAFGGATNQMGWYDRAGKSMGTVGAPGAVFDPAISPDERSVVFHRPVGGVVADLWIRDLNRGTETRLTSDASFNLAPFWSPKGDHIVFASNRAGLFNLYQKAAGGSGQDEPLLPNSVAEDNPTQWSRDGRFIVYSELDAKSKWDIWVLQVGGGTADRKPIPFLRSEFDAVFGQLSPDSHWMAFTSGRSGRREVYVRPFPPGEGEWPISLDGGQAPRWRGDGKELFFEAADGKMMAVPVKASGGAKPSFEAGAPVALFEAHMLHPSPDAVFEYDVTADGKRFLINTTGGSGESSATLLTVVTNWLAAVKK